MPRVRVSEGTYQLTGRDTVAPEMTMVGMMQWQGMVDMMLLADMTQLMVGTQQLGMEVVDMLPGE